jgi:hypothetical protein
MGSLHLYTFLLNNKYHMFVLAFAKNTDSHQLFQLIKEK